MTVTVLYMVATLAFMYVILISRVAEGQAFPAQVGEIIIMGRSGGAVVAVIVTVCLLGSLGAMQPGYPWSLAIFLPMVAVLLTLLVLNSPLQALLGLAVVAAVLPAYRMISRSRLSAAEEIVP